MSRNGERSRYGWMLTLGAQRSPRWRCSPPRGAVGAANGGGKGLWQRVEGKPGPARQGAEPAVNPRRFDALRLDRAGIAEFLAAAPAERAQTKRDSGLVISLPDPSGSFQAFAIETSPVMEPGLAARHPEIATYAGRGIDDPTATIRADLTPLGFHASVRSKDGAWYIDPYYKLDDSLYASYYGRAVRDEPQGVFIERDADSAELSVDRGYYLAGDTVTLNGNGYGESKAVTITISDPAGGFADRTVAAQTDAGGSFTASFAADPDGNLDTHIVTAGDGSSSASTSYQVVRDESSVDPPTGDVRRTYRLALITDPGYAAFVGGPANVTAAKATLMNRVNQVYEDDLSIHMNLIDNNDLLNLDTWGAAIGPNGPCGAAACFTQSQVTGCSSTARARFVIGQIIGASNYDIGHLALGQPGGGVANLGVVGRGNKAGGCTGIPTPIGDFYAIDYVAHEMGHQFSGNHPFNGNQLNCSGGNRSAANSVEPGSGSSIMAYAGICLTDDLQPHSDPYFSERSLQEISTYTSSNQAAINEVQTASLRHFGGGNEVQVVTFGPGYAPASTIQPLTPRDQRGAERHLARRRPGGREHRHDRDRERAHAPGRRLGHDRRGRRRRLQRHFTVTAVPTSRSFQYTNPTTGLATSGGGTVTLAAPGASESGTTVDDPHLGRARPLGRGLGRDHGRRRRRLQRHRPDHGRPDAAQLRVHGGGERPRQLGRRHRDVLRRRSRSGSAATTRP